MNDKRLEKFVVMMFCLAYVSLFFGFVYSGMSVSGKFLGIGGVTALFGWLVFMMFGNY